MITLEFPTHNKRQLRVEFIILVFCIVAGFTTSACGLVSDLDSSSTATPIIGTVIVDPVAQITVVVPTATECYDLMRELMQRFWKSSTPNRPGELQRIAKDVFDEENSKVLEHTLRGCTDQLDLPTGDDFLGLNRLIWAEKLDLKIEPR